MVPILRYSGRRSVCVRRAAAGAAGGFTLVELVTIVAIVLLLAGILAPSLTCAYRLALRAKCSTNMNQWYTALCGYAGSNDMYFPENTAAPARHISWCGHTVGQFWKDYLLEWDKQHIQEARYDVLYCPTQQWHRHEGALRDLFGLCGYFYMPHRDNAPWNSMDYTPAGEDWVTKKRFGENPETPIMADMKQYAGWIPDWYLTDGTPISSHRQANGEPYGGNYLFEDGRIVWYDTSEIALGATVGGWRCYYNIPLP